MSDKKRKKDAPDHRGSGQQSTDDQSHASESNRGRSPSMAALRHDVWTPLNHIIGYSEMLLEETRERDQGEFAADLQRIHAAGKQLVALLTDLLGTTLTNTDSQWMTLKAAGATSFDRGEGSAKPLSGLDEVASRNTLAGQLLLVVDDDEGDCDLLSRRLKEEGYRVLSARSGPQALELLSSRRVDLVLLDILMPEMSGHEVLSRLKADRRWREIPVIMISALHEIESVVQCVNLGAEDYLPKPFNPVLLRARIGACLEKKRLRNQEMIYLRDVAHVINAATAVEAGTFDSQSLNEVASRPDELGRLAEVFQRMALEVQAREQRLELQIEELRIEIDESKKAREVAEITETDYFLQLQEKARKLRSRVR